MSDEPTALAEVPTRSASLMEVISRAAADPNTDVDKLERLLGMYERISAQQAETAFNEAMNDAQAELGPIAADANNPQTKSKYASYPKLDKAVRPVYSKHGFSLSFGTAEGAQTDYVRVTCLVSHRMGHSRAYHVDMPADGKGAKGGDVMTKTHAVGAAMSYGQRYLLKLIFNIAVGDDDDGNSNGGKVREMGEAAKHAIAEINGCDTAAQLVEWKAKKSAGIKNVLTGPELKEVIDLFNRRVEAFKSEDVV